MGSSTGYGQFCPVAMAAEVMALRWTPLILRELLAGASQFNAIRRGLPLISRTTLSQRLRALASAGIVEIEPAAHGGAGGYRLTDAGQRLRPVIQAMGEWGQTCSARFEPDRLSPELLMWNLRRRLDRERLPRGRTVVRFAFDGLPAGYRRARHFWLMLRRDAVDLCLKDPGQDVDLYVEADIGAFARVWLGDTPFGQAVRDGGIRLTGPPALVRMFPRWLLLSPFATRPSAPEVVPTR